MAQAQTKSEPDLYDQLEAYDTYLKSRGTPGLVDLLETLAGQFHGIPRMPAPQASEAASPTPAQPSPPSTAGSRRDESKT